MSFIKCTYHNPLTLCFEFWINGELMNKRRVEDVFKTKEERDFFFKPCHVEGDSSAMCESTKIHTELGATNWSSPQD